MTRSGQPFAALVQDRTVTFTLCAPESSLPAARMPRRRCLPQGLVISDEHADNRAHRTGPARLLTERSSAAEIDLLCAGSASELAAWRSAGSRTCPDMLWSAAA